MLPKNLLKTTSLDKRDFQVLNFFKSFIEGEYDPKFATRYIVLGGDSGVGKSFIAHEFVKTIKKVPIYYLGTRKCRQKNIVKIGRLSDFAGLDLNKDCLVFMDNINEMFRRSEFGDGIVADDKNALISVIEAVSNSEHHSGILITTDNAYELGSAFQSRVVTLIGISPPNLTVRKKYISR